MRTPSLATLTVTAALTAALVTGCGSGGEAQVAVDPAPSTAPPTPSAEPTVGTYPQFEPTDYTYTLTVSCYCPRAGDPIAVTVRGGEVVEAAYADGERPIRGWRLTIADVVDAANDTGADAVEVDWPAGQAWPTSVWVDRDERAADEEMGYAVADVQVG